MLALMLASVARGHARLVRWRARFYKDVAERATLRAANRLRYEQLHAFAFDKFRVDELYEATFVRGFARWRAPPPGSTTHVVDGVVDARWRRLTRGAALDHRRHRPLHRRRRGQRRGRRCCSAAGARCAACRPGRVNNYVLGVAVGMVILVVLDELVVTEIPMKRARRSRSYRRSTPSAPARADRASLAVTPSSLSFDGAGDADAVELRNRGDAPLTIDHVGMAPDSRRLRASPTARPQTLQPGESYELHGRLRRPTAGARRRSAPCRSDAGRRAHDPRRGACAPARRGC